MIWLRLILVVALPAVAVATEKTDKEFRALYDGFTNYVRNGEGSLMSLPSGWFKPRRDGEQAKRVQMMLDQRKEFGAWVAEMVATTEYPEAPLNPGNRLYLDINLLHFVTGIFLTAPDRHVPREEWHRLDFDKIALKNQRWFSAAWKAGEYRDPSDAVARACAAADEVNGSGEIAPWSLVAIRRYGIFGAPELIAQVEKRNSAASFASYLIIYGDSLGYAEYIRKPGEMFVSKESKLERMRAVSAERKPKD